MKKRAANQGDAGSGGTVGNLAVICARVSSKDQEKEGYLIRKAVEGEAPPSEYSIAVEVFGRNDSFIPRTTLSFAWKRAACAADSRNTRRPTRW
jgi:hypothetical protein